MMRSALSLLALTLAACGPLEVQRDPASDDTDTGTPELQETDADGDGWSVEAGDCDDTDAAINPDATELCDGIDNDCSGQADDVTDNVWYFDKDLDGYGSDIAVVDGCEIETEGPGQWIATTGDCDDDNAEVNPAALEVCDSVDNDCDGIVDPDSSEDATAWFADNDGDGHGDVGDYVTACSIPDGYAENWDDCNDADPLVNPDQEELCDELDNDCDGDVDEGVTSTFYADSDGDGFGDEASVMDACEVPSGYTDDSSDCDDSNSGAYPGSIELCDGADNDCDGDVDEDDAEDASTWYTDADSDGYGDASSSTMSCSAPSGTVADSSDCDDTDADVNPGALEVCNDIDDDCDGSIDPSTSSDAGTWYVDSDGDSYGDASSSYVSCDAPEGYVVDATDCDDSDASSYPGATEYCDGADNDCDGSTDPDSSADAGTWYDDVDGDGYGGSAYTVSCSAPSGTVADSTDCDDTDSSVYPGATEYCDTQDNDCDGSIDEDVGETFYADVDGDGYGDPAVSADACSVSSGYSANAEDCDDSDAAINPGATELCDGIDNNCDGSTDPDDSLDASTWYDDSDADGYGDASSSTMSCSAPSGTVADSSDCDDTDASVNPAGTETCNGLDDDCDGTIDPDTSSDAATWYLDADSDGYGELSSSATACEAPSGYVAYNTDCDDGDSASYPGATEVCDLADNDCDGTVDEGVTETFYADTDGDGYGDSATTQDACEPSSGYVENDADCDDGDEYINPDALEVCADTVDNDCDGDADSSPCITEGDYEGDFVITLTETTYGLGSDDCEGTVSLTVDTTASPMISGTVECEFVGSAATYLPSTYSGDVEGDFDSDLVPSGTIDFSSFGWEIDWDDDGSTDDTVDGAYEGSDTYTVLGTPVDFDYEGSFQSTYTP